MLKVMRQSFQQLKWVLWLVVFVFVAFVFVDWGMGRVRGGKMESGDVASINGHRITSVDFNRQYRQTEDRYRQMYRQNWSPALVRALDLPNQVLSGMIDRALLVDAARRNGIRVSDEELTRRIEALPGFQRDGQFVGASGYEGVLAANGYTPDEFEREYREDLMIEKYNRLVAASLMIPDSAVEQKFAEQNEKAKIEYVLIPPARFGAAAAPTDAELLAYFEKNKERYRQPERRKLKYLLVEMAKLRERLKATPAEVRSYYEAHSDEFQQPARVHAAHILIKVSPSATPQQDAAAKKKAEEILAKAKGGADFAELARKYSDDPGSKDRGGDLGVFAEGAMVKPFEQAAFSMSPGEIQGPVKSPFGYHIIKLLEKIPAGPEPLEAATPKITAELTRSSVQAAAARRAEDLEKKVSRHESDEDLRRLASDVVSFDATDWVTAKGPVPGMGNAPDFLQEAFSLKKGEVAAHAVSTPRGPAIVKVVDVRAPGIPDFAEVKTRVAADLKRETEAGRAMAGARPLAEALASGKSSLESLAKTYDTSVETPAEFGRGAPVPGLGVNEALTAAIFRTSSGRTGGPVTVGGRGVVLFRVLSRTEPSPTAFAAQKDSIRESLRQQQAQKIIQAALDRRRAQGKLVVNDELLQRYAPKG